MIRIAGTFGVAILILAGLTFLPPDSSDVNGQDAPRKRRDAVGKRPRQVSLRERAFKADTPAEKRKFYSQLFADADLEKNQALAMDPNAEIAIFAAWERRKLNIQNTAVLFHPERFFGFLEARTGLPCPPYWSVAVIKSLPYFRVKYEPGALLMYSDAKVMEIYQGSVGYGPDLTTHLRIGDNELRCPRDTSLTDRELIVGTRRVPLTETVRRLLKSHAKNQLPHLGFSAVATETKAFLTISGGYSEPFSLLALNAHNGKLLWQSRVWAARGEKADPAGVFKGRSCDHIELVVTGSSVGVFGGGFTTDISYLEVFDIRDGRSQLRFHTTLWKKQ